jgi:hypothetical protein
MQIKPNKFTLALAATLLVGALTSFNSKAIAQEDPPPTEVAPSTPSAEPEEIPPSTANSTPVLHVVNHDEAAPWVGGAGQFPPRGLCPEGTYPLVLRTADHCYGPPSGHEPIVRFPENGYSNSNACQLWYAKESAAQAAPTTGWDGTWYVAGTQSTIGTAAVYCVKPTNNGLVAVDLEERIKNLEDRVKKLEDAPPGADQKQVDAIDERVKKLEDAPPGADQVQVDELKNRVQKLEDAPPPAAPKINLRLTAGFGGEVFGARAADNMSANGALGLQFQVGGKNIWGETAGLIGGGGHGIGVNYRGHVSVMLRCFADSFACGIGAQTSRSRYALEREGGAIHFDWIEYGARFSGGPTFRKVVQLRGFLAGSRGTHEETDGTLKAYPVFEAGLSLYLVKDLTDLVR